MDEAGMWFTIYEAGQGHSALTHGWSDPRITSADLVGQSIMSWYNLPSPSLPTSSCLQPHPPLLPPLCLFCLHSASSASTPPLPPPLHLFHLHSASSASALLQLQCILAQLVQLCHAHSQTNCRSIPDPFRPGSHAKGRHLYTLSTFVLFA